MFPPSINFQNARSDVPFEKAVASSNRGGIMDERRPSSGGGECVWVWWNNFHVVLEENRPDIGVGTSRSPMAKPPPLQAHALPPAWV